MNNKKRTRSGLTILGLFALCVWMAIPLSNAFVPDARELSPDCPNGPMAAELTGSAVSGVTPAGTARYRDRGTNNLIVNVRSVNVAANTSLDVYIGETKIGTITIGNGRSGQLRVDSPTATITEATAISVRNGSTTILSGTFACLAGGPNPTASPTSTATATPTSTPIPSPTPSPNPTVPGPDPMPTHPATPTQTPDV